MALWHEVYEDTCQAMGAVPDPVRCDAILALMEATGCPVCQPAIDRSQHLLQLQLAGALGSPPAAI